MTRCSMASLAFRKFTKPDFLGAIDPTRLIAFLQPWQSYLAGRDLALPADGTAKLDCELLAQILLTPDSDMPKEMIDALYYVHETSTAEDMDALLDLATKREVAVELQPHTTPADVAMQFWLAHPDLLRER